MSVFGSAKYIKSEERCGKFTHHDPLPVFRREFSVNKSEIRSAELFLQAPSFAEVYINGKEITADKFISPISDYTKILWYNVYEVGDLLSDGVNTVGVILGNSFFNETFKTGWKFHLAPWRDAPQFILSLKINGEEALVSNSEWQTSRAVSHIMFSHLRCGEYVDMRKYDNSWIETGYDASRWRAAIERDMSEVTGEFKLTECAAVRECESLPAVSVTEVPSGYLVDFGKNSSGYMEITVEAPRGQEIIFRYCEEVNPDGTPKHNDMDNKLYYPDENYEFQVNKLVASGGRDTFKPKFSYHGFRYVIIEGLREPPKLSDMRAIFIHNDIEKTADFVSGDSIINFIYTAGIRSSYSNMFWCLTDCPTREKLGWTNDAQASCEQFLINFNSVPLFNKWFEDMLVDQIETGELHGIIPTPGYGLDWGPVCDYFLFELPLLVYKHTGDASMLKRAVPAFERYRAFFRGAIDRNYEFRLGDWLGGGNSKIIPREFIRSVYYIKVLRTLSLARKLAGLPSLYDAELSEFEEEFLREYLTEDGRSAVDEQTACAIMIVLGLYRDKTVLTRQLTEAVIRDGAKLTSGMVGVQYLYDALSECSRPDLAYRIITESEPGYKTWYEHGATTLWERWAGVDICSHNHHMYSNVISWFFKSLLGISPVMDAPGYEKIAVNPQFVREMGFVRGYIDTPRGRISAEWEASAGGFEYSVTIPEGVFAEYLGKRLKTGKNTFFVKEN